MKLVWTYSATRSLLENCEFIAEYSPERAADFYADVRDSTSNLEQFPNMGKRIDAKARCLVTAHKCKVIYEVEKDSITILDFIPKRK